MLPEFLRIAQAHFPDIVTSAELLSRRASASEKLRLHLRDGSFADLWVDPSRTRYSFHWEHRAKRGLMHRFDNAPDFPGLATFSHHFHNGSESQVEDSYLSDDLQKSLRQFLTFIRTKLIDFDA